MIETVRDIVTKDGAMETFTCHPDRGAHPVVLFLMDAPGIRAELDDMARRLATVGYYVMLPNLYYRAGKDTKYGPDVLEKGSAEQARMRAVRTKMTIPPVIVPGAAMLRFRSVAQALGTHVIDSSNAGSTCPAINTHGCYRLTFTVRRVPLQ